MRAYHGRISTTLELSEVTDKFPAWHYAEEKQQFHFNCATQDCARQTDILGRYGYCPRCGRTNARDRFAAWKTEIIDQITAIKSTISDRTERAVKWEDMTVKVLSEFEAVGRHLRHKLLRLPMTPARRKQVEKLNFQNLVNVDQSLQQFFDISLFEWPGNAEVARRLVPAPEIPFLKTMAQKRHIVIHNGGVADQEYLDLSGDSNTRLGERIHIGSKDLRRFVNDISELASNLWDNIELGFTKE